MTGAEIAWRTLNRESVDEPCIVGAWTMKREFFSKYGGTANIYADPVRTAVNAFAEAGCNLNPQFIMPSPFKEQNACSPFNLPTEPRARSTSEAVRPLTAEDVRDDLDRFLSEPEGDEDCDVEVEVKAYAERLLLLRSLSRDRTLYIAQFSIPAFMAGYGKWSYESYLSALLLYPEHFRAYFLALARSSRTRNQAIANAIADHDLAPYVYNGDDICFNDGPICSLQLLDDLYFPALELAIEPIVSAGIEIIWHSDGNVLPIAQRLIDLGVAGFQGFQEREANIPLEKVVQLRRRDGTKLILFGSISVVHTFPFGSVADIRSEIERCFDIASPGGGFCLAPSSSILPETPMANIDAFYQHGKDYGRQILSMGGR